MIRIADPGPQTTVQDLGRVGQLRYGIPPSGPIDARAYVIANRLVGNADGAAGLECTLVGPRFTVEAACAIAVAGAEAPITINGNAAERWTTLALSPGDTVRIAAARAGVRIYIAFSGGLDVPLALGSRATYLRGRLGGLQGRSLKRDDVLRLFPAATPSPCQLAPSEIPPLEAEPEISVVLGPQADCFTAEGVAAFLGGTYEMLPQSDRMGARLAGPRIAHARGHDIISDGIALGSIQVPGDGPDRAAGGSPVDRRLHEDRHRGLVRHRPHRAGQARAARAVPRGRRRRGAPLAPGVGAVIGRDRRRARGRGGITRQEKLR